MIDSILNKNCEFKKKTTTEVSEFIFGLFIF